MHHEVALRDLRRFGDELIGALAPARRPADALAEQVLLAHERDAPGVARSDEAALHPQRDERHRARRLAPYRGPALLLGYVAKPVLPEQMREPVARTRGPGGHDEASSFVRPTLGLAPQLVEDVDAGAARRLREHRPRTPAAIDAGRAVGFGEGAEGKERAGGEHPIPAFAVQIEKPRARAADTAPRRRAERFSGRRNDPRSSPAARSSASRPGGRGSRTRPEGSQAAFPGLRERAAANAQCRDAGGQRRWSDRSDLRRRPGRTTRANLSGTARPNPYRAAPPRPGRNTSRLRFWSAALASRARMCGSNSIVSPNRSSRTGSGSPAGKTSIMPPRMAYSPGSMHGAGAAIPVAPPGSG